MTLSDGVEGPRNASRPRQGAAFVSMYTWTCVVLGVAVARLVISGLHKVNFGRDDLTAFAGSVGQNHPVYITSPLIVNDQILFVGVTATWHYTVNVGMGRHVGELSSNQIESFFKVRYHLLQTSVKLEQSVLT